MTFASSEAQNKLQTRAIMALLVLLILQLGAITGLVRRRASARVLAQLVGCGYE